MQAGGNQVERILSRTVGGRVILDLDVAKMIRSDPERTSVMIDAGTPMVRWWAYGTGQGKGMALDTCLHTAVLLDRRHVVVKNAKRQFRWTCLKGCVRSLNAAA